MGIRAGGYGSMQMPFYPAAAPWFLFFVEPRVRGQRSDECVCAPGWNLCSRNDAKR